MAQGGGQSGGMGGSPMGGGPFGGMYNSTNSTTTQDMMGGGGNNAPMGQTLGQLGLFGMGGQQDGYGGYGGGYNQMPQQGGGQMPQFANQYFQQMQQGPQNFNQGQIPEYASPFFQQMQQMQQQQPQAQLNQLMQGQPNRIANRPNPQQTINKATRPTTVEELYSKYLNRTPEKEGSEYWNKQFGPTIDADEISQFRKAAAPERAANRLPTTVEEMYSRYLDRAPDKRGLKHWNKAFGPSLDADEIALFRKTAAPELAAKREKDNQPTLNNAQQRMAELRDQREQKARQQRKADRLARRKPAPAPAPVQAPTDFSRMGQTGQFGDQGFASTLQNFAGQQYKDYAYNPGDQTFYKGGDKTSQGVGLGQVLQQGRAAGYKMASGGITSLRRR